MSTLQRRFGVRLKLLRLAIGLTQEQFAELAEVSTGLISNIERGINQPSFKNIERFSSVLNVAEKDLFDFSEMSEFQEKHGVRVRARSSNRPIGNNALVRKARKKK